MKILLLVSVVLTALVFTLAGKLWLRRIRRQQERNDSWESLNTFLLGYEELCPRYVFSLITTAGLMVVAVLYVWPRWKIDALAPSYVELASNPFYPPADNLFPHRILTPLLSFLIGLRGNGIMVTNLIIAAAFLLLVYRYFRKSIGNPTDALLGAAILAFSLPTLNSLFNSAYCDSLTYVLLFLQWQYRKKVIPFYLLLLLGLLNRESVLFMIPWMAFLRLQDRELSWRARLLEIPIGLGAAVGLYALFRLWSASHSSPLFSTDYYLSPLLHDPFYWASQATEKWLGLFSVFKLLWIVPVMAGYYMWKEKERVELASILLLMLCTWLQFSVAYDSSRILTQGFLIMVIGFEYLALRPELEYRKWLGQVFQWNLFVPQMYTSMHIVAYMNPLVMGIWPSVQRVMGL